MKEWRLLDTGPLPASHNMTLQWVLLNSRHNNWAPNTLHLLQFKPHNALVGYHQAVELEIEEEYCKQHNIEINRRISGGGCIYMDEGQLGWEVTALKDTPGIPQNLNDMYKLLCECAIAGIAKLGVTARYRPINDIEVDGRKISGTGGSEYANSFIFHGTLLTDFSVETMINCLKLPLKKLDDKQVDTFKKRVVSLKELLGDLPPIEEIKEAMVEGFSEVLGIKLVPGRLTEEEKALFEKELPRFMSEEWIRDTRSIKQASSLQLIDYKAPGGLIRVSLVMDRARQLIKSVFITGDFFAYPENCILDLEAALKNTSVRTEKMEENVMRFFAKPDVKIPGVTAEDMIAALKAAVNTY
ncbi:MAG: ligase [Firmicutes bacterium HGW-Firmicutes-12]|nr:MAG: ligase [Firmicutes bacterium HGW-Firmicutes-12]